MINKLRHFYFNKYLVSPFSYRKYFISYNFKYKTIWFRVYKVATRTIDQHLSENSGKGEYIYSSQVGYKPELYSNYFKFAFVRDPAERFISAWKDKVLNQNYFLFDEQTHQKMKTLKNFINWLKTQDVENCDEHLMAQHALIDINNVDFLGRFENFDKDFEYVANRLGFPVDGNLRLNPSGKKGIKLSSDELDMIKEVYHKDYEIFYSHLK